MHSTTSISLSYHSARPELPASCCQRSPPPSSADHDGCLLVLSQLVLALVGRVLLRRALPLTLARRRQLRQLSWEQGKIAYNCNVDVECANAAWSGDFNQQTKTAAASATSCALIDVSETVQRLMTILLAALAAKLFRVL